MDNRDIPSKDDLTLVSGLTKLGNGEGESWVTLTEAEAAAVGAELERRRIEVEEQRAALVALTFMGRTSGGIAGRDEALCRALNEAERVLGQKVPPCAKRKPEDSAPVETPARPPTAHEPAQRFLSNDARGVMCVRAEHYDEMVEMRDQLWTERDELRDTLAHLARGQSAGKASARPEPPETDERYNVSDDLLETLIDTECNRDVIEALRELQVRRASVKTGSAHEA